jgi:hypothetical protein
VIFLILTGCHFEVNEMSDIVPMLREQLDNLDMKSSVVAAGDENTYDLGTQKWKKFSKKVSFLFAGKIL